MAVPLSVALFTLPMAGQESEPTDEPGHTLMVHKIFPLGDLVDVNSRSGNGLHYSYGNTFLRFAVDGSSFPIQTTEDNGKICRIKVFSMGMGADILFNVIKKPQGRLYLLAGGRWDYWFTSKAEQTYYVPDNSYSSHDESDDRKGYPGLRLGVGCNLGPLVCEFRYRASIGDVRLDSDDYGDDWAWSACELSVGVRF